MRRTLVLVALLVGLVVAMGLSACAGPRNALNTTASTCFRGLPAAGAAVAPKAKLVGVRTVRRTELARKLPQAARIGPGVVCAVAYRGEFSAGDVRGADPAGPGRYAVVALDPHSARVLATFVLDELPIRFRHRI